MAQTIEFGKKLEISHALNLVSTAMAICTSVVASWRSITPSAHSTATTASSSTPLVVHRGLLLISLLRVLHRDTSLSTTSSSGHWWATRSSSTTHGTLSGAARTRLIRVHAGKIAVFSGEKTMIEVRFTFNTTLSLLLQRH